jgi:hypothetical protein
MFAGMTEKWLASSKSLLPHVRSEKTECLQLNADDAPPDREFCGPARIEIARTLHSRRHRPTLCAFETLSEALSCTPSARSPALKLFSVSLLAGIMVYSCDEAVSFALLPFGPTDQAFDFRGMTVLSEASGSSKACACSRYGLKLSARPRRHCSIGQLSARRSKPIRYPCPISGSSRAAKTDAEHC